jgi:cell division protein DivIC
MKKKKVLLWAIIAIFFGTIFIRQQFMISRLRKEYLAHQEHLGKIKIQSAQLNEQLKQSKKSDYIEKLARQKLGLVKPGEILFIDKNKVK